MLMKNLMPWSRTKKDIFARPAEEHTPIANIQREMNRIFEDFWRGGVGFLSNPLFNETSAGITPKADMSETVNEVCVSVELPGVDEKNIEVSLSNGMLTIKGEKREECESKEGTFFRKERYYGSFCRSISIPEGVDEKSVDASFKNGVLKIKLPKTIEAKMAVKRIPVKAA
jgi:HSP20 family protein